MKVTPRRGLKQCHNPNHLKNSHEFHSSPKNSRRRRNRSPENSDEELDQESDFDETDRCYMTVDSELESSSALGTDTERSQNVSFGSKSVLVRNTKGKCNRTLSPIRKENPPTPRSRLYPDLSEFRQSSPGNREDRRGGPGPVVLILFVFVLLISLFILGSLVYKSPEMILKAQKQPKDLGTVHSEIKGYMKVLSSELQQTKHFWVTVASSINDVVEDSPPQPSIILALVPSDAQKTAMCLLQRLTDDVSSAFEDSRVLMFDGASVVSHSAVEVSHDLDDFFLELEHQHTAVIHNLEKIPPESVMILHAFCDNENAPHKRALIIFTIGIDLHYSSLSAYDLNADRILNDLWRGKLRDVDSAAIISRIANSPVIIKPEEHSMLDKLCPYK